MTGKAENSLRPKGFTFSEEEFQQVKQQAMMDIITGKQHFDIYDSWVLRGMPREELKPTVVLGIFPTPALTQLKYIYEPEVLVVADDHRPIMEYWQDATTLPFPQRAHKYEQRYFRELVSQGDSVFQQYLFTLISHILPSAMILFGRTGQSNVESAYLYAPTLVPPSAIYRHMKEQANLHLHML